MQSDIVTNRGKKIANILAVFRSLYEVSSTETDFGGSRFQAQF